MTCQPDAASTADIALWLGIVNFFGLLPLWAWAIIRALEWRNK